MRLWYSNLTREAQGRTRAKAPAQTKNLQRHTIHVAFRGQPESAGLSQGSELHYLRTPTTSPPIKRRNPYPIKTIAKAGSADIPVGQAFPGSVNPQSHPGCHPPAADLRPSIEQHSFGCPVEAKRPPNTRNPNRHNHLDGIVLKSLPPFPVDFFFSGCAFSDGASKLSSVKNGSVSRAKILSPSQ